MPPAPVSAPGGNGEGDTHGETPVGVMQSGPRYFFPPRGASVLPYFSPSPRGPAVTGDSLLGTPGCSSPPLLWGWGAAAPGVFRYLGSGEGARAGGRQTEIL